MLLFREAPDGHEQAFINAGQARGKFFGQIVPTGLVRKAAQSRGGDGVRRAAAFIVRDRVSSDVELCREPKLGHAKDRTQCFDSFR